MLRMGIHGIHVLPRPLRIAPSFPVELSVRVDDATLRVALDWPVGERPITQDNMADALFDHRDLIERTLRAHLFAHGVPLSGQVVLDLDDFRFAASDWRGRGSVRPRRSCCDPAPFFYCPFRCSCTPCFAASADAVSGAFAAASCAATLVC